MSKNRLADRHSPIHSLAPSSMRTHERFSEIGHMPQGGGNGSTGGSSNGVTSHQTGGGSNFRSNVSLFGGTLNKTFATGWVIMVYLFLKIL